MLKLKFIKHIWPNLEFNSRFGQFVKTMLLLEVSKYLS